MPVFDADARLWAETHGVVLSAALIEHDSWRLEAKTENGTLGITVETDGSHIPDPFDCLFGAWEYETPDGHEYVRAGRVLGPAALADLARLLGWL